MKGATRNRKAAAVTAKSPSTAAPTLSCQLVCGTEVVPFEWSIDDFRFTDFNSWASSRFGLLANQRLIYRIKESGSEVLPSASVLATHEEILVETIQTTQTASVEGGTSTTAIAAATTAVAAAVGGPKKEIVAGATPSANTVDLPTITFAMVMCIYLVAFLGPLPAFRAYLPLQQWFAALSHFCSSDSPSSLVLKPSTFADAFVGFITWSSSYMFVRRLLNPENGTPEDVYKKYAADMLFGGMAASTSVLVKALVTAHLSAAS